MSVQSQAETVSQSTTRMIYRALSSVSGSVSGWKIKVRERAHQVLVELGRTLDGGVSFCPIFFLSRGGFSRPRG